MVVEIRAVRDKRDKRDKRDDSDEGDKMDNSDERDKSEVCISSCPLPLTLSTIVRDLVFVALVALVT